MTTALRAQIGTAQSNPVAAKQAAFEASIPLFEREDYAAAEVALEAGNYTAATEPSWQTESAALLIRAANLMRAEGLSTIAQHAEELALKHLGSAETALQGSGAPGNLEAERELTGSIYESLGQRALAEQWYTAATQASPGGIAAYRLAKLKRLDAIESARSQELQKR